MRPSSVFLLCLGSLERCASVVEALATLQPGTGLVVHEAGVDPLAVDALVRAADAPLVASVSGIDIAWVSATTVMEELPLPPPTLAAPHPPIVLIMADALQSFVHPFNPSLSWAAELQRWAEAAVHHGWRHVGAPGLLTPTAAFEGSYSGTQDTGVVNELLATHRLWGSTRLHPLNIVLDGACLVPGAEATGTFQVLIELTRQLAKSRPDALVTVAVPHDGVDLMRIRFGHVNNVTVRPRTDPGHFDIVYRPYQFLRPEELEWTFSSGARVALGQLDMIGFSNDSYHPRPDMFFAARNMQRASMRRADLVTTISEFALSTILAECPDLEPRRLAVIPCGTDHVSPVSAQRPHELPAEVQGFIACLSATFWHKNRPHAIRTFAELRHRGYRGHLVIAGPQPYFGRSTDAEDTVLASIPEADRCAVHRLGAVDEAGKWWLLQTADAVLYPSINEGFGLVPFEAATAGTPALAGATASLPEVFGPRAVLASSWSPADWADIVEGWLIDPETAKQQVDALRDRARELTWQRSAERTWAAFDMVLGLPRRQPSDSEGDRWVTMESHRLGLSRTATFVRTARRVDAYARRRLRRSI